MVAALRPHNLTLQNYASIAEQQVGGFIQVPFRPSVVQSHADGLYVQVGAHGTGATVPPVDQTVSNACCRSPLRRSVVLGGLIECGCSGSQFQARHSCSRVDRTLTRPRTRAVCHGPGDARMAAVECC